MTFERTRDLALIRSVLTEPRIWRHISDDFSPPRDTFEAAENDAIWYVAVRDEDEPRIAEDPARLLGLFVFFPHSTVCWEIHTALLPWSWGERARQASLEIVPWIWANTACRRIITNVPEYNRLALRFAKEAGLIEFGVNPQSYQRYGRLHSQIMLGISPKE